MPISNFDNLSKWHDPYIRREDSCAVLGEDSDRIHGMGREIVRMIPCVKGDENQQWIHTKQGRLIHKVTNKCLDAGQGQSMEDLHVGPCKASISTQIWFFDVYHDNVWQLWYFKG